MPRFGFASLRGDSVGDGDGPASISLSRFMPILLLSANLKGANTKRHGTLSSQGSGKSKSKPTATLSRPCSQDETRMHYTASDDKYSSQQLQEKRNYAYRAGSENGGAKQPCPDGCPGMVDDAESVSAPS